MADTALRFLLDNLKMLLVDHAHLVSGAKVQLRLLENELQSMKSFLEESAKMEEKGERFRQYEREVREAVHLAEDTIDEYIARAAVENTNFLVKIFNPTFRSLAKKVKSLREDRIKPILPQDKRSFATAPMVQVPDTSTTHKLMHVNEETFLRKRKDKVVGFEDQAKTIIKYLNKESDELEVISIIGMPGLGKTTLAWKIFHDESIKAQFPILIWVDVSQKYRRRKVFLDILEDLIQDDMSRVADTKLAQIIELCLKDKKFLLILDDVWNAEHWEDIEVALPKCNGQGKVLITSRHQNVAWQPNRRRHTHRLDFLNPRDSWELLQLEVFGNTGSCPSVLEQFGKIIARGCGGVPLAIVVIGGILLKKNSTSTGINEMRNEWEVVSNSVQKHFNSDEKKRTKEIIALSYNELPLHLRDCFLYLGMFPEETAIPIWKLIRMWIAEGFVEQKLNKSLEDVAVDNLKDLKSRNLVMLDQITAQGHIKTCRVHDLIREFCKGEASIENQNLFQEMEISGEGTFDPPVSEIQKQNHRRLCIHSHIEDFLCKEPKGPRVRSFVCFAKDAITLLPENVPPIPADFNLLRVLDVNPIKLTKIPAKITQLIHLRYIALSGDGDDFKVLPKAISMLWNLQTITIDTKSPTFEIKANIWKMMQLRHMKTKAAIVLNKKVKGKAGENLRTLSRLSAQCCTEAVFNRAKNLKNLGIRGQLANLLDADCLEKLDHLQKLKLVYDVNPKVASENPLRRLPQPEKFPPNLTILELSSTFLTWKHMST